EHAIARGLMPSTERLLSAGGAYARGRGHMPSLTNPNNLSIVTGAPPSRHGISGNHVLGPAGVEVQLNDPSFARATTIYAELQAVGSRVLSVTAKDKLRRL